MAQIKKTSAPTLPKGIIVDFGTTTEGQPYFRVTPIWQDGYQYTLFLTNGILNLLRLVGIVKNTQNLFPI